MVTCCSSSLLAILCMFVETGDVWGSYHPVIPVLNIIQWHIIHYANFLMSIAWSSNIPDMCTIIWDKTLYKKVDLNHCFYCSRWLVTLCLHFPHTFIYIHMVTAYDITTHLQTKKTGLKFKTEVPHHDTFHGSFSIPQCPSLVWFYVRLVTLGSSNLILRFYWKYSDTMKIKALD